MSNNLSATPDVKANPGLFFFLSGTVLFAALYQYTLRKYIRLPPHIFSIFLGSILGYLSLISPFFDSIVNIRRMPSEVIHFVYLPILVFQIPLALPFNALSISQFLRSVCLSVTILFIKIPLMAFFTTYILSFGNMEWAAAVCLTSIVAMSDTDAIPSNMRLLKAPYRTLQVVAWESLLTNSTLMVNFAATAPVFLIDKTLYPSFSDVTRFNTLCITAAFSWGLLMALSLLVPLSLMNEEAGGEVGLIVGGVYMTFFIADELMGISGVISVLVLGVCFGLFRTQKAEKMYHVLNTVWLVMNFFTTANIATIVGVLLVTLTPSDYPARSIPIAFLIYAAMVLAETVTGICFQIITYPNGCSAWFEKFKEESWRSFFSQILVIFVTHVRPNGILSLAHATIVALNTNMVDVSAYIVLMVAVIVTILSHLGNSFGLHKCAKNAVSNHCDAEYTNRARTRAYTLCLEAMRQHEIELKVKVLFNSCAWGYVRHQLMTPILIMCHSRLAQKYVTCIERERQSSVKTKGSIHQPVEADVEMSLVRECKGWTHLDYCEEVPLYESYHRYLFACFTKFRWRGSLSSLLCTRAISFLHSLLMENSTHLQTWMVESSKIIRSNHGGKFDYSHIRLLALPFAPSLHSRWTTNLMQFLNRASKCIFPVYVEQLYHSRVEHYFIAYHRILVHMLRQIKQEPWVHPEISKCTYFQHDIQMETSFIEAYISQRLDTENGCTTVHTLAGERSGDAMKNPDSSPKDTNIRKACTRTTLSYVLHAANAQLNNLESAGVLATEDMKVLRLVVERLEKPKRSPLTMSKQRYHHYFGSVEGNQNILRRGSRAKKWFHNVMRKIFVPRPMNDQELAASLKHVNGDTHVLQLWLSGQLCTIHTLSFHNGFVIDIDRALETRNESTNNLVEMDQSDSPMIMVLWRGIVQLFVGVSNPKLPQSDAEFCSPNTTSVISESNAKVPQESDVLTSLSVHVGSGFILNGGDSIDFLGASRQGCPSGVEETAQMNEASHRHSNTRCLGRAVTDIEVLLIKMSEARKIQDVYDSVKTAVVARKCIFHILECMAQQESNTDARQQCGAGDAQDCIRELCAHHGPYNFEVWLGAHLLCGKIMQMTHVTNSVVDLIAICPFRVFCVFLVGGTISKENAATEVPGLSRNGVMLLPKRMYALKWQTDAIFYLVPDINNKEL